ncbi:MAG: amidohydrolase family protein [Acidimicrobiia bacterium]|nr:amidohydrolase family protein [Acidimicrobiia bacterium]
MAELTITNARLRAQPELVNIEIEDGLVGRISPSGPADGSTIDAAGGLVTEGFTNAHLHLDKVFTLAQVGEEALRHYQGEGMGKASLAIDAAAEVKRSQDADQMLELAKRSLAMAAYYGTTHVRAMADVDSKAGTRGVEVLCAARDEFAGIVDVQVVAFPQDGIVREKGAGELLRRSMELGADVVGGIPWIEYTTKAMADHIRTAFDLAVEFDADVSMLLDDAGDPELRTLETMAQEAIDRGWHGRALAHHCRAMHLYSDSYFGRLVEVLREAGVSVVSDPHTGPLHARVGELLDSGINVILGQDDISDAYYAFGRNNMMEVAFLGCHLLWMMTDEGQERLYDSVTINGGVGMNVAGYRLAVGNPANLVVHGPSTVTEVLRFQAPPTAVVSHGRLVDLEAMKQAGSIPD